VKSRESSFDKIKWMANVKILLIVIGIVAILMFLYNCSLDFCQWSTDIHPVMADYILEDGEPIIQSISEKNCYINKLQIQCATYGAIQMGVLTVDFYEDGNIIQEWVMPMSELVDNSYQEFEFDSIVYLNPQKTYSFSIIGDYNERIKMEDPNYCVGILVCNGENSCYTMTESIPNSEICYALTQVDAKASRRIFVVMSLFILVSAIGILIVIRTKKISWSSIIYVFLAALIIIFILDYDLLPKINTEVALINTKTSNEIIEIEPKSDKTFIFDSTCDEFETIEIFVSDEVIRNPVISLGNLDTGAVYLKYYEVAPSKCVISRENGVKAYQINISDCSIGRECFERGKYQIDIFNMDDEKILQLYRHDTKDKNDINEIGILTRKHTLLGYKIAMICLASLNIYFMMLLLLISRKKLDIYSFFILSVIVLGTIYFLLMQPWSAPDSGSHYMATYRFSNLISGYSGENEWKGRYDDAIIYRDLWNRTNPRMRDISLQYDNFGGLSNCEDVVEMTHSESRMKFYSIVNYLPQVIGLFLARQFELNSILSLVLARLFAYLVYVLCCYRAICNTPVGKTMFAVAALLPYSLMMSSSFSYDLAVIIASLNYVAIILKLQNKIASIDVVELLVWSFILAAVKGGGLLILLPLLLMLFKKHNIKSQICMLASLVVSIASVILFNVILAPKQLFQFGVEGNGNMSASFAYLQPVKYLRMLILTYIEEADYYFSEGGLASLCWLEQTFPTILIAGIVVSGIIATSFEKDEVKLPYSTKIPLVIPIILLVLTMPMMLLSWTPLGSKIIEGVQGRYFFPIMVPTVLLMTKYTLVQQIERVSDNSRKEIQLSCLRCIACLCAISIYYLLRLYLTR